MTASGLTPPAETLWVTYIMFTHHLSHFLKNRKKSILKIFFQICINKIAKIFDFRPKFGEINLGADKTPLSPLQKKIFPLIWTWVDFYRKSCYPLLISRKFVFLRLGRFGYKKASKIKEFYFFQNLQDFSFLLMYTLLGIFLTQKKLSTIEIPWVSF